MSNRPPSALLCPPAPTLAGCRGLAAPWLTYEGAIERIDEIPGEPGVPTKGPRRLTRLQLRITRNAPPGEAGGLGIFMLDLYNGGVHGAPGDAIRFSYAGRLPVNRELWFGWLNGYRIVHRAAVAEGD